jgi:hypothetical protein
VFWRLLGHPAYCFEPVWCLALVYSWTWQLQTAIECWALAWQATSERAPGAPFVIQQTRAKLSLQAGKPATPFELMEVLLPVPMVLQPFSSLESIQVRLRT